LGSKRKQVIELLSRKGAQINEVNKELLAPLHIAADYCHFDVMETFIRLGARVNITDGLGQTGEYNNIIIFLKFYIFNF